MIKPFKGKNPNHEKFFIPRSVQQSIPIKKVHKDGIFEVAGFYSKTWRFFDVNYAVAGPEKKEALFLSYCAFLNSLPVWALVKITLFNRTMNQREFSRNLLMQMAEDGRNRLRAEYNDNLTNNAANSNNLTQEKYITISVERKNIEEARAFFNRVGTELGTYLSRMDVTVRDMLTGITQNVEECLRSDTAKLMFANSEFLLMFNQAATDRIELAKLLGTSDTQMDHVNNAPAGHGLIKVGGAIVPFINDFPKDTELYRLMSTRPGEG